MRHTLLDVGGKAQPSRRNVVGDDFLEPRLVYRDAAAVEQGDFLGVQIKTQYLVAHVRQTRAGDKANIAGADYGYFHGLFLCDQ